MNCSFSTRVAFFALALSLTMLPMGSLQAQTFTVIHEFAGGQDGANPFGALTLDRAGHLYGTASGGGFTGNNCGVSGCGTVFRLTQRNGSWVFSPLYSFQGYQDGFGPLAGVSIGANGSLYGTTEIGGSRGVGIVYNLQPPAHTRGNSNGGWTETILHSFTGNNDGRYPLYGSLVFDQAGNMYGTTFEGGIDCDPEERGCGAMYELTPQGALVSDFDFSGNGGGGNPPSGVILDSAGNLYGVTDERNFAPVAYELTRTGNGWNQTVLFTFPVNADVRGGVTFDGSGGLYGTRFDGSGEVYQLSPAMGQWSFNLLYMFSGNEGPWSAVTQDASGNLYGTTCGDGANGLGSVFKLTHTQSGWAETDLYDFSAGSDGYCPVGAPVMDASGNLYGTTLYGGTGNCFGSGCGVVWEITP